LTWVELTGLEPVAFWMQTTGACQVGTSWAGSQHVVAARLGHADPSITLRVYAHVISDQLTEAADIFARAVAVTT
jgi:integrase